MESWTQGGQTANLVLAIEHLCGSPARMDARLVAFPLSVRSAYIRRRGPLIHVATRH
jgi:hypothetical protein